jgi:hypothetical protein
MSREVRRVPLDFDWPLGKVWDGYLMPDSLAGVQCPDCKNGYAPHAQYLHDLWYGYVEFRPEDNGSVPLTPATPAVRAFAERNVQASPGFYGTGESAIVREAQRLCDLWNVSWGHHLNQADVQALVDAGRLMDFTHDWKRGDGWTLKSPPAIPSAEQVNEWAILAMGHDSINAWVAVRARCERDGQPVECATCQGQGNVEAYSGQRQAAEAWQATEPPTGDGWQLWSTVSEGHPVTPAFATDGELIDHLATEGQHHGDGPMRRSAAESLVRAGSSIGTFLVLNGQFLKSSEDADLVEQRVGGAS